MAPEQTPLKVFIGWDSREDIAYQVAKQSLEKHATIPVEVIPIKLQDLVDQGLYTREIDPLASTEFTYSRFLVPHLAGYQGWAIFVDCDFLFFGDVAELQQYMDPKYAVLCVQHDYQPKETTKMDGVPQSAYPRKNWSSFMLMNCAHPSTRQLTPELVNRESGAYLHRMQWAQDEEIGALPTGWNWLEGWYDKPAQGTRRPCTTPAAARGSRNGRTWTTPPNGWQRRRNISSAPAPETDARPARPCVGAGRHQVADRRLDRAQRGAERIRWSGVGSTGSRAAARWKRPSGNRISPRRPSSAGPA